MKAYKLTDKNNRTKYNTQWGENVTHKVANLDISAPLCSSSWIHFYTDPVLAVLMNLAHANFTEFNLWEVETRGAHKHEALKSGATIITTIKQLDIPVVTIINKIAFGILCALKVYKNEKFVFWADEWLSGKDRGEAAAYHAYNYAIAGAAAAYATYAGNAVVCGTYAYNYAIAGAAANAAAYATYAAYATNTFASNAHAYAAAAVDDAFATAQPIDFVSLAHKALTYE